VRPVDGHADSPKKMGLIQFVGKNDRVIFVLPWHNRVVVGTTDVANPVSAMPTPSAAEVDQVIREYKSLVDEDWPQKVRSAGPPHQGRRCRAHLGGSLLSAGRCANRPSHYRYIR